jgi:ATPase family associated with various cellular activities (AAA)
MSLERYLGDQYNRDLQDVAAIEQLLKGVAATFGASFDRRAGCWPYVLKADEGEPVGRPSQGTSAMILAAIGKMYRFCTLRDGSTSQQLPDLPGNLLPVFGRGVISLAKQVQKTGKVYSGTFGTHDPLTISHLAELIRGLRGKRICKKLTDAIGNTAASKKIGTLISKDPGDGRAFERQLGRGRWCAGSGFVALRIVRAQADLTDSREIRASSYRDFFESALHEQLSFSSIPDSRFDPAELAFCLEGLLVCAHEAVDPVLFERVFTVLAANQETSAYWRPNRPFIAKPTGEIALPLSVEGANSLLRSVEIMDGKKLHGTFDVIGVPMFRRFFQWLRARKVEINSLGTVCIGWHSEHINEAGVIHLWNTSQVLEFLIAFRNLIQRYIARETLILSGVRIDEPKKFESWDKTRKIFEPLMDTSVASRIFDQVEAEFVRPWQVANPSKNYSMLVYGPPGTGKTTIAQSIADALEFRLLTVTVSDFLGAGGALVEARAKAIFQMLEAQSNCVIFFDEIDAFLLDRDSTHYRDQDTLFQFLTPGMLIKINDLRTAERSILIIATNYENRIDPAIKRPGRIDRQYLLLPPDLEKRKSIIQGALPKGVKPSPGEVSELSKASLYLNYKEIVGAVGKRSVSIKETIDALNKAPRSSSPKHYLVRLEHETTFPEREFIGMVKLASQAGKISDINNDIQSLDDDNGARSAWRNTINKSPDLKRELCAVGVQV